MRHTPRLAACLCLAVFLAAGCTPGPVKAWEAAEARVAALEAKSTTQPALDADMIAAKAAAAAAKAAAEEALKQDPLAGLGSALQAVGSVMPQPWGGLVGLAGAATAAWFAWRYRKLTVTIQAASNGGTLEKANARAAQANARADAALSMKSGP